MTDPKLLKGSV